MPPHSFSLIFPARCDYVASNAWLASSPTFFRVGNTKMFSRLGSFWSTISFHAQVISVPLPAPTRAGVGHTHPVVKETTFN